VNHYEREQQTGRSKEVLVIIERPFTVMLVGKPPSLKWQYDISCIQINALFCPRQTTDLDHVQYDVINNATVYVLPSLHYTVLLHINEKRGRYVCADLSQTLINIQHSHLGE